MKKGRDGIHVGSRIRNIYFDLEFYDEEDWWDCGCYDHISGIDEQLIARNLNLTDHPTGDTFEEKKPAEKGTTNG